MHQTTNGESVPPFISLSKDSLEHAQSHALNFNTMRVASHAVHLHLKSQRFANDGSFVPATILRQTVDTCDNISVVLNLLDDDHAPTEVTADARVVADGSELYLRFPLYHPLNGREFNYGFITEVPDDPLKVEFDNALNDPLSATPIADRVARKVFRDFGTHN